MSHANATAIHSPAPLLDRLPVRTKLIGSFAILLLMAATLGAFALNRVQTVRAVAVELEDHWLTSVEQISALNVAANRHRFHVALHILNTDDAAMTRLDERIATFGREVTQQVQTYTPLARTAQERQSLQTLATSWQAYLREVDAVLVLSRRNANREATELFQQRVVASYQTVQDTLAAMTVAQEAGADAAGRAGAEAYDLTYTLVFGILITALLAGIGMAFVVVRGVVGGISGMVGSMQAMAAGDLDRPVPNLPANTEFGAMAATLGDFRLALVAKRAADQAATAEAAVKVERGQRVDALVRDFEAQAAEALRVVAAASTELNATAGEMARTAEGGQESAASLAAASEQASVNVQTVASSAEELAASISEVARQVTESAAMTRRAAEDAQAADATVAGLAQAAERIGSVVRLIGDIAGQTNLLALNATIEAARAGEHGKGFAVVASEVKALAAQTAKATVEIGQQITAMQGETTKALSAMQGIGKTIESLNAIATGVAAAAEEQAAATMEIGRAVAEAAAGTQDVSRHASGVTEGASQTGAAASEVRAASGELSLRAEDLRGQVDAFLSGIRAA